MQRVLRPSIALCGVFLIGDACLALFTGCGAAPATFELSPDHPASPAAAEAPMPPISTTLAVTLDATASDAEMAPKALPTQVTGGFECPMHPEVVASEPGRCPKCGMKLIERAGTSHQHGGDR